MPPVRRITGGVLYAHSNATMNVTLESASFAVQFHLTDPGTIPLPGDTSQGLALDVSANNADFGFGTGDFGGQPYDKLWFGGNLQLIAKPFTVAPNSSNPIRQTTPFAVTGRLAGYTADPNGANTVPPLFDYQVSGRGRVTVSMYPYVGNSRSLLSLFYLFL